ncbi:hypothetical protein [Acetobacter sp. DsW_063]|uniref:hypothetical protein n=1 Tax=Acetobacter sp. DsW_063 TaxID=1514894 RepID=UPI000A380C1F|nr:hypothetical protein [Acetobacter sp. DsW_063]OUJ14346.1 hypothetical protein HK28_13915 [Acetobacter sp. DsW_063]
MTKGKIGSQDSSATSGPRITHLRAVTDAALERCQSASALISALSSLLDPTIPTPSALQAARVQRAARRLVDAALTEHGSSSTRLVGAGLAALYTGLSPERFDEFCESGHGPTIVFVNGEALFDARALDERVMTLSRCAGADRAMRAEEDASQRGA